jgi:hypothetical protein
LKYPNGDYVPRVYPIYVPLKNYFNDDSDDTDANRQREFIDGFVKKTCEKDHCEIVTSLSGTYDIPRMLSYQVNYNDFYNGNYQTHRCSNSRVKEYFKYKSCCKKHKKDLIFTKEHFDNFIISGKSSPTDNKGHDVDVAICNHCNIAFSSTNINKGFLWALKSDISHCLRHVENIWFDITMPIYELMHRKDK